MKNSESQRFDKDLVVKPREHHIAAPENIQAADGEKLKTYLRDLQSYIITGEKTGESLEQEVLPLRSATYLRADDAGYKFPVCYDLEKGNFISLYGLLEHLVEQHFNESTLEIIQTQLPEIFSAAQKKTIEEENGLAGEKLVGAIIGALRTLDISSPDTEAFALKIKEVQNELSKRVNILFDFTEKTAFQLLNLQNQLRSDYNSEFLKILKKAITGLKELLSLQDDESDHTFGQFDFAEELISFNKIRAIEVDTVSSHLPKSSLKRLKSSLQTLLNAQEVYSHKTTTIFASTEVIRSFDLEHIFTGVNLQTASDSPCYPARLQSQKDLKEFVKTIAALRMGNLMIEQKYDEHLHDIYFDQFDLSYLTKDDLKYLAPTIVIEDSRQLMRRSNDFLALLGNDSFVKILGVNHLDDLFRMNNQDEPNYLELASLAIFRRNSYVFQGGIDSPSALKETFKEGLDFPGSVVWNVLMPSGAIEHDNAKYFELTAAIESRYFPRIEYKANERTFAGRQIKLDANPAADASFSTYEQEIKSGTEVESKVFQSTIPAFLAMNSSLKDTLEIIDPMYQNPNFISVEEYLELSPDALHGKIPFIWMVDDQNTLKQAAIPVNWIQICRNRLEYWTFLQSIAGTNKTHMQADLEALKSEWEEAKNGEVEKLKSTLNEQFEQERSGILEQGISRMLSGLLNEDDLEGALMQISKQEYQPKPEVVQDEVPATEEAIKEEEEYKEIKPVTNEAWVESEECTSCKDCIVALPSVFKYNDDKQAYVYNPKGGTFAQIVAAAEKCPARCIHPGTPQNKNEKSLEKWIKRAEKYN